MGKLSGVPGVDGLELSATIRLVVRHGVMGAAVPEPSMRHVAKAVAQLQACYSRDVT